MPRTPRLGRRAVKTLLVASFLAIALLALALNTVLAGGGDAGGPFDGRAMPTLYPDSVLPVVSRLTAPAERRADAAAHKWLASHPVRDDVAFANYAVGAVGRPPGGDAQQRELAQLHRIDSSRTAAGAATANWLELHGKKDVWKLFLKQYRESVPNAAGDQAKTTFKATYALAKTVVDAAKNKYARPSPYITDPSLHALTQSRFTKKYSYPSKHAVISFAEATYLTRLEPHRGSEYEWMADEISYSRLYAGGHYPSDISAGVFLGRMIADYEAGVQ
ncbi:MAG: phosphatase PAP2 family protein [Thermoleophilia bacterium]|nr:phosphatase PAP2 family protein [Thermoleophilia bacterium]